jgi:ABC-type Na+ efflux pump permease subunit
MSRFALIYGADLRFHLTRPLTWVLLIIVGIMSFGLAKGWVQISTGDSTIGGNQAWVTSEFAIALMFPVMAMLFYGFFVSVASGTVVPRDDELGVGPLLHATPLRSGEYVWAKFAAVLSAFVLVMAVNVVLLVLFSYFWPHADADKIRGPFDLLNYLRPVTTMALPAVLFLAGVSFAIGERARQPILVYAFPTVVLLVCLFFLFDWAPTWLDPRWNRVLMWIEPSGYRWVNETWLKLDRGLDFFNTTAIHYDLPFLLSRVAFVVLGLGSVALAERSFAVSLRGAKPSRREKRRAATPGLPRERTLIDDLLRTPISALGMRSGAPNFISATLTVAGAEARNLARQPGLYIFIPVILVQVITDLALTTGAFDTPLLLTPGLAAVGSMGMVTFTVCMLLMFYTGESLLRERNTGLAPIFYATPARTAAILFGKALANAIVAVVVLVTAALGAMVVMLVQGTVTPNPMPFVIVYGLLLVPTFLVWTTFVAAVVSVTGNRYATYAVGLGAVILTAVKQFRGEMSWVGNWTVGGGALLWSDFGLLQPNLWPLFWNRVLFVLLTAFFVLFTVRVFWRREPDSGRVVDRLRVGRLLRGTVPLLPVLVPILVVGVGLHLSVAQGFQGQAAEKRDEEYRGRNLATWLGADTPELAGVVLDLTLDPPARHFEVSGTYDLVNYTERPFREIPLSVGQHFEDIRWTLDGEEVEPDDRAGLHVFTIDPPMAPGDTVAVTFAHHGRLPNGITKNGGGVGQFILPTGVVLTSFSPSFVPLVGFEEERGVDADNRIDPRDYPPDFYEGITPPALGSGARFHVRTRITGPEDYAYHAVGRMTDESVTDGQRTVTFETDHPVNFFNVVAGQWTVHEGEHSEIHHLPAHTYNIEEMGRALDAARTYYSAWFYPYPWQDLRLNEFPGLAGYAQGFPTNITFSESIGFLTRSTPEAQAAFLVTAHEAAHQWWGNLLMPGKGPGGNVLSEGMAHYSTALLIGEVQGEREQQEFLKRIEEQYGDARQVDSERPLVWVTGTKAGDTSVTYDKGGWVFWMLHQQMGAEAMFAGLHAFIDQHQTSRDFPVLQDFLREMRPFAPDPDAFDAFAGEWFLEVVVPEYRFTEVEKTPTDGGYLVTATVENVGTGRPDVVVEVSRGERFATEPGDRAAEADGHPADHEGDTGSSAMERDGESSGAVADAGAEEVPGFQAERTTVTLGPGESAHIEIRTHFEPERLLVDPDVRVLMLEREAALARL